MNPQIGSPLNLISPPGILTSIPKAGALSGRWKLGMALALGTAFMWGWLPLALKKLLEMTDPYTVTWYRLSGSAAIVGLFLLARRGRPRLKDFAPNMPLVLLAAAAGLCLNYILYIEGLSRVSPGTAQVVIQLAPVLMLVGGIVVFREKFAPLQWAGLLVFLSGFALFFNHRLHELLFSLSGYKAGVFLVVAAAVAWAGYSLAQKKLHEVYTPSAVLLAIYIAGSIAFLPMADAGAMFTLPPLGLVLLAFCTLNTVAAYACFAESLKHWESTRVSALLTIVPLITLSSAAAGASLIPWLVAPEPLGPLAYAGAGMVVAGSLLAALWKSGKHPVGLDSKGAGSH